MFKSSNINYYLYISFNISVKTQIVIHYLSNHEAHEAEDPHRDMSGSPHEEVDDVGVK